MARITVEDCLEQVPNRFELIMVAAKRARQILGGESEPMVDCDNDKATVIALREIAAGLVDKSILDTRSQRVLAEFDDLDDVVTDAGVSETTDAEAVDAASDASGEMTEVADMPSEQDAPAAPEASDDKADDANA